MTSRRRWPIALAAVATVAIATGVLLARTGSNASPTSTRAASEGAPRPEPAHPQAEATEEGAVDTALQLAAAPQRWLYLTDTELSAAVREVASPRAADGLVADVTGEVGLVRDALRQSTGRIWWVVRPLAWRVEELSGNRASVSIWTVSILSASDVALPQSDWFTSRFDLEWAGGKWQLVATRDEPGPTPQLGGRDKAWQPEPFDDALAGFTRVGAEEAS